MTYTASLPPAVLRGPRLRDEVVFRAAFLRALGVSSAMVEDGAVSAVSAVSALSPDAAAAGLRVFFAAALRGSRCLPRLDCVASAGGNSALSAVASWSKAWPGSAVGGRCNSDEASFPRAGACVVTVGGFPGSA